MTEFLFVVMIRKMTSLLKIVVQLTFVPHLRQRLLAIVILANLLLMIVSLPLLERYLVTATLSLILVLLILILGLPLLILELPPLTLVLLHAGLLLMIVI
jgi:hypothetical protein